MGLVASDRLRELVAARRRREMELEAARRAFRLRADGGLRCEPLRDGRRDPLGPRTDAPAKAVG